MIEGLDSLCFLITHLELLGPMGAGIIIATIALVSIVGAMVDW